MPPNQYAAKWNQSFSHRDTARHLLPLVNQARNIRNRAQMPDLAPLEALATSYLEANLSGLADHIQTPTLTSEEQLQKLQTRLGNYDPDSAEFFAKLVGYMVDQQMPLTTALQSLKQDAPDIWEKGITALVRFIAR